MVDEAIKRWVAVNYGDGTRVTSASANNLLRAMMLGTLAPLPAGYTKADITEDVRKWARDNVGWTTQTPTTPPVTPPYTPPTTGVPEAIKRWVAVNYGDGTRVTSASANNLLRAMMLGTLAPLPAGYTKADITEDVRKWARDNVGWTTQTPTTPPVTPPYTPPTTGVPEAIKRWVAVNYGDGTRVTSASANNLLRAMMLGTLAPLPAGYTKADITEDVRKWARDNVGWTTQTPTTPPYTPPVTPPYTPPVTPPVTGKPGLVPTIVYSAKSGCVLQLASFPGGADYWIDGYPPGAKSGVTKDYSKHEWDYLQLSCGEHSIFVRIPGYEDIEEIITVGTGLTMFIAAPDMISATGTPSGKVGTLAVTAEAADTGETIPWGLVRLRSEKAKTGGVYVGITPYSGKVETGKYNVVVSAKGYEDTVRKVTINMNQRTSVAFSLQPVTLAAVLKIVAGGPAYIAGMSFKDYDALFVGNTRKDWVRIETTILATFRVRMTWYHHIEGEPVSKLTKATELFGPLHGVLTTEKKVLSPHMTATERHLDFAEYIVPNHPGLYRVAFVLEKET